MKILIYGINFTPELTGIGKYTGEMAATGRKYAEDHLDREAVLGSTARFPSLRAKRGNSLPRTK